MFLRKSFPTIAGSLVLCFGAIAAQAAVIGVPAEQPTIQAAISAAANGDTVQVAPGTYVENLNFLGKAIRVISDQGPQVTIIDGNNAGSVVTFNSGEGPQSELRGFTVRNGRAQVRGGGIRIENNSSPTITGNIVVNNRAADGGGGISTSFSSPVIQGNTIAYNGQIQGFSGGVGGGGVAVVGASSAVLLNNNISGNSWSTSSGGGITLFAAGTPTIKNNLIANNSAYSDGGGIAMFNQSDAAIVQNVITGNTAPKGGGLYWLVPSGARGPFLINNTISANSSPNGSGIFADGFDVQVQLINNIVVAAAGQNAIVCGTFDTKVPTFSFNDVVASAGSAYSGSCTTQTGMNGNISVDPLFRDVSNADYHLQSGSPAIDSGTANQAPLKDADGVDRPTDGDGDGNAAFDMGAFEAPAVPPPDRTAPETTATRSPLPNSQGWNNSNVTVSLSATDNPGGSGVESIRYQLSGAENSSLVSSGNPAQVPLTAEATTTVAYYAVDNAGNTEITKSLTVKIDKSIPTISGMPEPNCTLSPAKHQLVTAATISASDALSGIAAFTVTATSNESDAGTGGGDVPVDIVINGGTVQLRAERSPRGNGRVYTITAAAVDVAGYTATATATCKVPK
jgi:hypothetical protein